MLAALLACEADPPAARQNTVTITISGDINQTLQLENPDEIRARFGTHHRLLILGNATVGTNNTSGRLRLQLVADGTSFASCAGECTIAIDEPGRPPSRAESPAGPSPASSSKPAQPTRC
jgi:hypothetical protein